MNETDKKSARSALPVYAAACTWLVYMAVRRVYRATDFLLVLAACVVTFVAAQMLVGALSEREAASRESKPLCRPAVAAAVCALLVLATGALRWFTRPAPLPPVHAREWVCDTQDLLADETKTQLAIFNAGWDERHDAVCAVASVASDAGWESGWSADRFASTIGARWGLGPNDLLLLFVAADGMPHCHLAYGDNLAEELTEEETARIENAVETGFAEARADGAVRELLAACTAIYPRLTFDLSQFYLLYAFNFYTDSGWTDHAAVRSWWLLGSIAATFVLWAAADLVRYRRYRRRLAAGEETEYYHPVFWGRS
ncbi:MAG: TPM domain-containing protein [Oscillibacter sp.]|nr:TPM domain-containing protein [Oscillibacter sp.]